MIHDIAICPLERHSSMYIKMSLAIERTQYLTQVSNPVKRCYCNFEFYEIEWQPRILVPDSDINPYYIYNMITFNVIRKRHSIISQTNDE